MAEYADSQLGDEKDYGQKNCPDCEGTGETEGSNCCGAQIVLGDICFDCMEHTDNECPECDGSGKVDRDVEDETEAEWDAKMEK